MNRRDFFRRAATAGAGIVLADKLEMAEAVARSTWVRRFFPGWSAPSAHARLTIGIREWDALLMEDYVKMVAVNESTPLKDCLRRTPERLIPDGKGWNLGAIDLTHSTLIQLPEPRRELLGDWTAVLE